jgi:hypothetical protein
MPWPLYPGKTWYPLYRRLGSTKARKLSKENCALWSYRQTFHKSAVLLVFSDKISVCYKTSIGVSCGDAVFNSLDNKYVSTKNEH